MLGHLIGTGHYIEPTTIFDIIYHVSHNAPNAVLFARVGNSLGSLYQFLNLSFVYKNSMLAYFPYHGP